MDSYYKRVILLCKQGKFSSNGNNWKALGLDSNKYWVYGVFGGNE